MRCWQLACTSVVRMFSAFSINITWTELLKRTAKEVSDDNVLGLAAQLAYYFLLGLVPAIVCVLALTSFLPSNLIGDFINSISGVAPPDVVQILRDQLTSLNDGQDGGVFTIGVLLAVWSTSAAMVSIIDALNRAYDLTETRPWWKVRLVGIALTIGVAVFIVSAVALVMIGPELVTRFGARVGLGPTFTTLWSILRLPVAFVLVAVCIGIIFHLAPDADQDWEFVSPGAVLATVLWVVASLGFRTYVANFADYNESYGSLGGVIVLMLWFYISALAVLVGAEMNAEIEHASEHGKDPGERVPGERPKLGAAARRWWEEQRSKKGSTAPSATPASAPAGTSPRPAAAPALSATARRSPLSYLWLGLGLYRELKRGRTDTR